MTTPQNRHDAQERAKALPIELASELAKLSAFASRDQAMLTLNTLRNSYISRLVKLGRAGDFGDPLFYAIGARINDPIDALIKAAQDLSNP